MDGLALLQSTQFDSAHCKVKDSRVQVQGPTLFSMVLAPELSQSLNSRSSQNRESCDATYIISSQIQSAVSPARQPPSICRHSNSQTVQVNRHAPGHLPKTQFRKWAITIIRSLEYEKIREARSLECSSPHLWRSNRRRSKIGACCSKTQDSTGRKT